MYYEDRLVVIPLAAFNRFLKVDHQNDMEVTSDHPWILKLPDGVTCLCKFDSDQVALDLNIGGGKEPCELQVMVERNKRGRWFFRCDCCFAYRDFLILDDGRFVCRETFVSEGRRGDRSIRRASVTMAMADLGVLKPRARPIRRNPPEKLPELHDLPLETDPSDKPGRQPADWYTTTRAVALGRGANQYDRVIEARRLPPEYWESLDPAEGYERPLKLAGRQLFPELDIRTLIKTFTPSPDCFLTRTLCWGERADRYDELLLIMDWRGSLLQAIVDHSLFEDVPRWQTLPLAQRSNGRFHFVCPIEKKGCEFLYLRNGIFASFNAQQLVYPSQRTKSKISHKSKRP